MNLLTLLVLGSVLQDMGELIRKYLWEEKKKRKTEIENVSRLKLPSPAPDIDNSIENREKRRKADQKCVCALSSLCDLGQDFCASSFFLGFHLAADRSEMQTLSPVPPLVWLPAPFPSHTQIRHCGAVLCSSDPSALTPARLMDVFCVRAAVC